MKVEDIDDMRHAVMGEVPVHTHLSPCKARAAVRLILICAERESLN